MFPHWRGGLLRIFLGRNSLEPSRRVENSGQTKPTRISSSNIKNLSSCNLKELVWPCATEEVKQRSPPSKLQKQFNAAYTWAFDCKAGLPCKVVCQTDERSEVNFAKPIISETFWLPGGYSLNHLIAETSWPSVSQQNLRSESFT